MDLVIKRSVVVKALALLLALAIGMWMAFLWLPVVTESQGVRFIVRDGASFQSVISDLKKRNIIQFSWCFRLIAYLRGDAQNFKAGEYLFPPGATAANILEQLRTGSGVAFHLFTIIPGWTFQQIRDALQHDPYLLHHVQQLSDREIMQQLGRADLNVEGVFFPDTYYFVNHSSDLKLLKRAFKTMQDKLNVVWEGRAPGLPYKESYEVLIAASLVEKEAHFDSERPIIAGVIINRLRQNMLLQIDPTVIYGLGVRYQGKIYKKDLLENTPYNTYVHKGLPPTPIAMPGIKSLEAVAHPEQNDYIYYVADGSGHHQFSKTLLAHHAAVVASKKNQTEFFNAEMISKRYLLPMISKFFLK